ncbi:MAG: chemotaxis protein CheW [Cocleimonas sp.]
METIEVEPQIVEEKHNTTSFTSSLNSKIGSIENQENIITRRFYYTVGQFNILIEKDLKAENLQTLTINTVPNAPTWCSGIVSVRGIIMPVVNMHIFLNTKELATNKSNFIILEHKDYSPIIFQTDDLPTAINLDQFMHEKCPENTPQWVENHLSNGKTSIFEANHKHLLQQFSQY